MGCVRIGVVTVCAIRLSTASTTLNVHFVAFVLGGVCLTVFVFLAFGGAAGLFIALSRITLGCTLLTWWGDFFGMIV